MEVSNAEAEESDGKLLRARIVVVGSWWFGEDWAKKSHPDDWRTTHYTGKVLKYDTSEKRWEVDFDYESFRKVLMTTNAVRKYLRGPWPSVHN